VRSTALGGEVLTRLNQSGNKKITHVPAEGFLFATQQALSASVLQTYRNPLGTTETNKAVYDPLGNYIPYQAFADPRPPAGSYSSGSMASLSSSQANPDSYGMGCIMDGLPTSCNRVMNAINRGQAKTLTISGTHNPNVALANLGYIPQVRNQKVRLSFPDPLDERNAFDFDEEVIDSVTIVPGGQPGFEQNHPNSKTRSAAIDPKLKKSIENCAQELYGVTAKGAGFTPTTRGTPGSFEGSRIDKNGIEQEVNIVNENRSYDGWQLGARAHVPGTWLAGLTFNDTT
jgi:hypothetical protein